MIGNTWVEFTDDVDDTDDVNDTDDVDNTDRTRQDFFSGLCLLNHLSVSPAFSLSHVLSLSLSFFLPGL